MYLEIEYRHKDIARHLVWLYYNKNIALPAHLPTLTRRQNIIYNFASPDRRHRWTIGQTFGLAHALVVMY